METCKRLKTMGVPVSLYSKDNREFTVPCDKYKSSPSPTPLTFVMMVIKKWSTNFVSFQEEFLGVSVNCAPFLKVEFSGVCQSSWIHTIEWYLILYKNGATWRSKSPVPWGNSMSVTSNWVWGWFWNPQQRGNNQLL